MSYSNTRRLIVLAVLFLAWLVGFADRVAISTAIIPITSEFKLDPKAAGYVLSAFYVTYSLMQIAGGWMANRFGARNILIFSVLCWSLFTGLTGLTWSFASLIVVRLLFGMGEGGFAPASSVAIVQVFPVAERARAKSFLISSTLLGGAIGTGVVSATIYHFGWRPTYHVLGVIGIALAAVLWIAMRPTARLTTFKPVRSLSSGLVDALRDSTVRKTSLIWFMQNAGALGLQAWMPMYLMKTHHIDLVQIGMIATLPYVAAFVAVNGVGWLLDKVGAGCERMFMAVSSICGVASMAMMMATDSLFVLTVCWVAAALSYNFVYATVFSIPLKRMPEAMVGNATGLINFGGQLAGAVAPAAMGWLISHFHGSFVPAFGFLLGTGVVAFLVAMTWRPTEYVEDGLGPDGGVACRG
ncbi:MFS transporter [Burkholderia ubonensis]|uniref:MFS transporter n=1 Tax=Burkholderia ubonensis TaxID=101571 RepID=UPI000755E495|nr:MFS transporter [Burkholderia ubonensis]KVM54712.1 MFS transporter [Burkholderia ubonensis]